MTALANNTTRGTKGPITYAEYPVAASTTIYAGSIVMLNSAGYALPAAALASNKGCVGVAAEKVVNSGSAGAATVRVAQGLHELPITSTGVGETTNIAYASTDNDTSDTQGTNEPVVGAIEQNISASSGWVRVGPAALTRAIIS